VDPPDEPVPLEASEYFANRRPADAVCRRQLGLGGQAIAGPVAGVQIGQDFAADLDEARRPDPRSTRDRWHKS
jgi:hypothetical protein